MLTRGGFLNIGIITFPRHKLCRLSEDPLSQAAPLRDIREMAGDPAILTGWLRSDRMMRLLFFNDQTMRQARQTFRRRATFLSGVFQHPLNFSVGNQAFKLDQFIVFTGVIHMAKTLPEQLAQTVILHELPQRIALADRER